jgi:hypothetical protein
VKLLIKNKDDKIINEYPKIVFIILLKIDVKITNIKLIGIDNKRI